jgi:hypothetical protein
MKPAMNPMTVEAINLCVNLLLSVRGTIDPAFLFMSTTGAPITRPVELGARFDRPYLQIPYEESHLQVGYKHGYGAKI